MSISYDQNTMIFKLDTLHTTYAMAVTPEGYLGHLYYGTRIAHVTSTETFRTTEVASPGISKKDKDNFLASFPYEYPTAGIGDYRESCIDVLNGNGEPGCELFYDSYEITDGKPKLEGLPASFPGKDPEGVQTLSVILRDKVLALKVTLLYSVFEKEDVITRSVLVTNESTEVRKLRRVLSACLDMDSRDFAMLGLFGCWSRERHKEFIPLHNGRQVISSQRGVSSPHESPFAALVTPGTDHAKGEVYAMNFVYSGNFIASADVNWYNMIRMVMGINPVNFSWTLAPGETFTAPEVVETYSDAGLSQMTLHFHRFYRRHLIRNPYEGKLRPVLINNWEGTMFDFDEEKIYQIAKDASAFGIDMMVLDDGWFGNRFDDNRALGDWTVNEEKLKGGLGALVSRINALGMKFGLWFEPEMISEDSDLYRAHPDWAIKLPGREPSMHRNQLVLDIARKEVRDYIMDMVCAVLHSAPVDYVKWDMNRYLSDLGSAALPADRQGELSHRYVLGLYEMQERLLTEFPGLLLENCSSGGARFDPGMLYYSPQIWTSDDTDAIERLRIQEGTALVYPVSTMGAHVSSCPSMTGRMTPFETRANVALEGTFGYELVPAELSDEDKAMVRSQVERYRKYHMLYENGDYYHLQAWNEERPFEAWMAAAEDGSEALITYVQVLNHTMMHSSRIFPCGLCPDKKYKLTVVSGEGGDEIDDVRYGDEIMHCGILMPWLRDFESRLVELKEI